MKKLLLIEILALSACLGVQAATAPQPDKVLVYKTTPQAELKLHIFTPPGHRPGNNTPAIVFFHGGGWNTGGAAQFFRQSRYLADRGMVAISAEYRLGNKHKTTPRECVKDGKSAIRWIRTHAKELGIDPDKLAAGGGSAGGHVAAATALLTDFDDEQDDLSVRCRPDALVLFNPVIDNGPGGYGHERVSNVWKKFSPIHNISAKTPPPPAIFMLGTEDKLIPVSTGEKFKQHMEATSTRCDLILYDGEGHAFFNNTRYEESITATDNFLVSLGYLPNTAPGTPEDLINNKP